MKEKKEKPGKKGGTLKPLGAGDGDDRFASIATDPRFARFPKAKGRIAVDTRFKAVFDDPRFATAGKTDKRGRKTQGSANEGLKKYYRLQDDEAAKSEEQEDGDDEPEPRAAGSSDDEDDEPLVGGLARPKIRGIRGSVSPSSSDDDEEMDEETEMDEGVIARFAGGDEEDIPLADETNRLAVVDLEWDRIRAVDIYAILRSFLPPGGSIRRVTVYLSDFGKERLAEEERYGPRAAFDKEGGDDDDDEEEDGDKEANKEKMRKYERDRLRYYYAVCELDSIASGQAIYQGCDGMEFERSSTRLDLRFVPDEQTFEGRTVRDVATGVPSDYVPVDYTSKALQQTNAQLSWDQDDPERRKKLRRKLTADQLKEEDFAAFLGSESEDDNDGDNGGDAEKLRSLLLGTASGDAMHKSRAPLGRSHGDDSDSDGGGDMVATFDTRLEQKLAARAAGKDDKTVWEAYQDKKKEKKKDKKLAKKKDADGSDDDGGGAPAEEGPAENGFDDPFFMDPEEKQKKAKKEKKGKKGAAGGAEADPEEARRRAELELLMMDDSRLRAGAGPAPKRSRLAELDEDEEEGRGRGKGKSKLGKKERKKLAKQAKLEAAAGRAGAAGAAGGETALDVSDPRFAALFERAEYALDPTDPRYKTAGAVSTILGEAAKRRRKQAGEGGAGAGADGAAKSKKPAAAAAAGGGGGGEAGSLGSGELGAIVANLKRKSQR